MTSKFNYGFIISMLFLIISGCKGTALKQEEINQFEWLLGSRVDTSSGFYEIWEKSGKASLKGSGYQIEHGDTVFGETLSIEKTGDNWAYVVEFETEKTIFKLTSKPGDSLVFENPGNEFPKRITYLNKKYGKIVVSIDNPGDKDKIIHFNFSSQNK